MQGALNIGRLRTECSVFGAQKSAQALGDRVLSALHHHLPDALRRTFAGWFDGNDDSVWVLRSIECTALVPGDAPSDALASMLAESLTRALIRELTGDGDGVRAIRFASPAAYLARFVSDAAAGHAWARWYFAPFAGIKSLPSSAAIRTALVENPERGLAALELLEDHDLARVAAALTAEDEERVLSAFSTLGPVDAETTVHVLAAARVACWRALDIGLFRGLQLIAFTRADRSVAPAVLFRAIAAVIRPETERHSSMSSKAGLEELTPHSQKASPEIQSSWPGMLASKEAQSSSPTPAQIAAELDSRITTRLGGLCLLFRDLDNLPWDAWAADFTPPPFARAILVLKWLTLSIAAGRLRATRALDDAALRMLFGIPADASIHEIGLWLRQIGAKRWRTRIADDKVPQLSRTDRSYFTVPRSVGISRAWCDVLAPIAGVVLRRFARRLPGFSDSSPEHLWRNFLAFDAAVECEQQRIVVRCGRPPLHLLLTLTGMTRGLVAGFDAKERPILLFPGD